MKSKILILLTVAAIFSFMSCTKENDLITQEEELTLAEEDGVLRLSGEREEDFSVFPCIEEYTCSSLGGYTYPEPRPNKFHFIYQIAFSSSLTLQEVECRRRAYFECIPQLRRYNINVGTPYTDTWYFETSPIIPPGDVVGDTTDDDSDVCIGSDCD